MPKVTLETLATITQDFMLALPVVERHNTTHTSAVQLAWDVWHKINHDKTHTEATWYSYRMMPRLFAYDPQHERHPDNSDDNTLTTALLKALKQAQQGVGAKCLDSYQ